MGLPARARLSVYYNGVMWRGFFGYGVRSASGSRVTWRSLGIVFGFGALFIADSPHAVQGVIRHVRQILDPLRDIRHPLNRREVQGQSPSRPEEVGRIFRRQEVMRAGRQRQKIFEDALTFAAICSSETLAIHASRARLRLTHWYLVDQSSQVLIVVFVLLVNPFLTWC